MRQPHRIPHYPASTLLALPPPQRIIRLFGVDIHVDHLYEEDEALHGFWQYTKKLTISDINGLSRFLISKNFVVECVLSYLKECEREALKENGGSIRIDVYDVDTDSAHQLTLRRWKSNSFVLINNWRRDFVYRRKLQANINVVAFSWEAPRSRFLFSVI